MSENPSTIDAGIPVRLAAIGCLQAVLIEGQSLGRVLEDTRIISLDKRDRRALNALCYGVLRWYYRLDAVCAGLLKTPFRQRDTDLHLLLLIALFQLMEARAPGYAIVSSSVNVTEKLGKTWAKGLINAVLRSFIRQPGLIEALQATNPSAYYAYPAWLMEEIRADWPSQWRIILDEGNIQAPLMLRVNARKGGRAEYLQRLVASGITAEPVAGVESAIRLHEPCDIQSLPGFAEGWISVQNAAAQQAAVLLSPLPGERILDGCAAPGGKTTHLLELQPEIGSLLALDHDALRLQKVQENLARLVPDLRGKVLVKSADLAGSPECWWDGRVFDRILLDVPCSATGVIRRHPDIKHLRKQSDITLLCDLQRRILRNAWTVLRPGGVLLYATCSVLKRENEQQMHWFLRETADAVLIDLHVIGSEKMAAGYQLLPQENGTDGFYYAALLKNPPGILTA